MVLFIAYLAIRLVKNVRGVNSFLENLVHFTLPLGQNRTFDSDGKKVFLTTNAVLSISRVSKFLNFPCFSVPISKVSASPVSTSLV